MLAPHSQRNSKAPVATGSRRQRMLFLQQTPVEPGFSHRIGQRRQGMALAAWPCSVQPASCHSSCCSCTPAGEAACQPLRHAARRPCPQRLQGLAPSPLLCRCRSAASSVRNCCIACLACYSCFAPRSVAPVQRLQRLLQVQIHHDIRHQPAPARPPPTPAARRRQAPVAVPAHARAGKLGASSAASCCQARPQAISQAGRHASSRLRATPGPARLACKRRPGTSSPHPLHAVPATQPRASQASQPGSGSADNKAGTNASQLLASPARCCGRLIPPPGPPLLQHLHGKLARSACSSSNCQGAS